MCPQDIFLLSLCTFEGYTSQYKGITAAALCLFPSFDDTFFCIDSLFLCLPRCIYTVSLLSLYSSCFSLNIVSFHSVCFSIPSLCLCAPTLCTALPLTTMLSLVSLSLLCVSLLFWFSSALSFMFLLCLSLVCVCVYSPSLPHLFFSVSGSVFGLKKGDSLLLSVSKKENYSFSVSFNGEKAGD